MKTNEPCGKKCWTPDRIQDLSSKTYVITSTTSGMYVVRLLDARGKLLAVQKLVVSAP